MIVREPFQVTVAQQVGAASPMMRQAELSAVEHRPGDGRTHALQGEVGLNSSAILSLAR